MLLHPIPRIAMTPGEPAGIGPDLCIELLQQTWNAELVLFADADLLAARARRLGRPLNLVPFEPDRAPAVTAPGTARIVPVALTAPVHCGRLDPDNAIYVLETLRRACEACLLQQCDALVTAPVHKGVINDAGIPFSGHTEFLANQCGVERVVMMLTAPGLRVALLTTHLPLKDVSAAITTTRIAELIQILDRDLRHRFAIAEPRILVCGLNPHAGEGGHLGREEVEIIEPALEGLRERGLHVHGPLPADTVFLPKYLNNADAVMCMYHDQGLPVLKHMGFGRAVNVTLGLPIIRTSVDHGTALPLAGSGDAEPGSLIAALELAVAMTANDT